MNKTKIALVAALTAIAGTLPITPSTAQPGAAAPSGGSKAIMGQLRNADKVGDKWAVVIGINNFADPTIPTLKYSSKDARDFYDYLTSAGGGKFEKDHCRLLLNADATKVNIMDALGDSFLPHAAAPGDLVVIYLSTHGSPAGADINGVNYAVAYDTQVRKLFATGIEMQQLLRMIKERVHTNRIVLVMDTCYSGAGAAEHKGIYRSNIDPQKAAQGIGSVVISSSAPDQRAWESDELQNSYFTRFFIDALGSKDVKPSVDQAFNSMKSKVQAAVLKDKGEIQTPVMGGAFAGSPLSLSIATASPHAAPILLPDSSGGEGATASDGSHSTPTMAGAVDLTEYVAHMRAANKLIEERKLWDAIHELQEAVKQNPGSIEANLVAAEIYDDQERYNDELMAARKAVVNDDNSSKARQLLGLAYLRTGYTDEAIRQTEKAIEYDPNNSMAHNQLGYIDEHLFTKVDKAAQEYQKALELNPANVRALVNLGLLEQKAGKTADAEAHFRKAIAANADDPEALLSLAKLMFVAKNDYAGAESELRKAIQVAPANWEMHSELGIVLAHDKTKYAAAEDQLRKGVELAPDKGAPHALLGAFLLNPMGRPDEAEKEYRTAIGLDSTLDAAQVGLANMLVDSKKV
ncbi:MAG: tetratricopeptide repeat protein, partial [Terriglobales bacterium]